MHTVIAPAFAIGCPLATPDKVAGPPALRRESPAGPESESPAPGEWVRGLTEAEAEDLLDWLEAHGRLGATVSMGEKEGFGVRCPWPPGPKASPEPGALFRPAWS
jgi:hypothetical protein